MSCLFTFYMEECGIYGTVVFFSINKLIGRCKHHNMVFARRQDLFVRLIFFKVYS